MANQAARITDTNSNSNVRTSPIPTVNVGTYTNMGMAVQRSQEGGVPYGYVFNNGYPNTHMAMVTQLPQEQRVAYGYGLNNGYSYGYGYQYGYPQQFYAGYPIARHFPSALPPPQAAPINVVCNIFQDGKKQGHTNNDYDNPGTYQFQPVAPQLQRHDQRQLQQPQGGRLEIMQGQRSQSGSGESGDTVFWDDYNLLEFVTRYANAKFFVIKSYNKEHVVSSIRHGVWTSTYKGNQKLNTAYTEAASLEQRVQGGTITRASSSNCPIFLLFSVNRSGIFCGVAEMVGPVHFGVTSELWDWKGEFPVKWHIIKDVPFRQVLHITLESNQGRSIIYSRDCQQVEKEKGEEILDIFKNYVCTTSLLDEIAMRRGSRVQVVIRMPPSLQQNHDQEYQGAHEKNEEGAATTISCSCSNENNMQEEEGDNSNQEEEETDHNNPRESEGGESQESEKNVISVTSHNSLEDESRENQQNVSTVITMTSHISTSNNKKQEEESDRIKAEEEKSDHNNLQQSKRTEDEDTKSTSKKEEEETDCNKQREDTKSIV